MRPGIRAARDQIATETMLAMMRVLGERFGVEIPDGVTPTRGNTEEKAMFQREAVAKFLRELAWETAGQRFTAKTVTAWMRENATLEELEALPGIGKATAEKIKAGN